MNGSTARAVVAHAVVAGGAIALAVTTTPALALSFAVITAAAAALWLGRATSRERASAVAETEERMRADLTARIGEIEREKAVRDAILGAMDEAVILVEDGVVAYANGAARRMLGAVDGRPPPPQIPLEGVSDFEIHHPTFRSMRGGASALPGGALVVVAQDVTEARRTDAIRRDFVANASHELKTPVAGIMATAETLRDAIGEDAEAARGFAAALSREAARLSAMIQDLLDLARLDQPRAQREPVDWSALVRGAVEEASARAGAKDIAITSDVHDGLVVQGRAQDLAQLARNLLDNAINYTPAGGRVTVSLAPLHDQVALTVADTGIGIPAKELPRIFERFYRVDRARSRDTGGTGLGLAIVRHIAESHGGSVRAESELGRGSRFVVTLPGGGSGASVPRPA